MAGKLFVVGTPIGNLSDFSSRGIETLSNVDFIAAEDTRVTRKLLNRFHIQKPMFSYYEHNRIQHGAAILYRIQNGEDCALVTDAGMPAISDPGEDLVCSCHEQGIEVVAVPGPSAVITALAVSGLSTGRFCFEGFLSVNKKNRKEHLEELKEENRTMVFYEAPHKLAATLNDMVVTFGDRRIVLTRELTKIHEEIRVTTLVQAAKFYERNPAKGEFVIIIEGAAEPERQAFELCDAVNIARECMHKGMSASVAAKTAAAETGLRKSEIYSYLNKE